MAILLITISLALGITFVCSLLESVVLSLHRADLAKLRLKNAALADIWDRLKRNLDEPIAAILIVNTAAHTMGATIAGAQVVKLGGEKWLGLFSLVYVLVIIQFGEILPKTLGVRYRYFLAAHAARPLVYTLRIVSPLTRVARFANRPFESEPHGEAHNAMEEIRALASYASFVRLIDPRQERIISKSMELDETTVGQAMVPRTRVVALEEREPLLELLGVVRRTGLTRVPVYRGHLDNLVGLVHVKDLLTALHEGKVRWEDLGTRRVSELVAKALFIPETVTVADFMAEATRHKVRMMMVVDEYGGFAGVMTVGDALEELVGEIAHGRVESVMIEKAGRGRWVARGLCPVEDLSQALGVNLESKKKRYATLSGLLMLATGKVPKVGEVIKMHDLSFRVLEATATLPLRIEITKKSVAA